nr:hypothetical protein [uncultured bacterium]
MDALCYTVGLKFSYFQRYFFLPLKQFPVHCGLIGCLIGSLNFDLMHYFCCHLHKLYFDFCRACRSPHHSLPNRVHSIRYRKKDPSSHNNLDIPSSIQHSNPIDSIQYSNPNCSNPNCSNPNCSNPIPCRNLVYFGY